MSGTNCYKHNFLHPLNVKSSSICKIFLFMGAKCTDGICFCHTPVCLSKTIPLKNVISFFFWFVYNIRQPNFIRCSKNWERNDNSSITLTFEKIYFQPIKTSRNLHFLSWPKWILQTKQTIHDRFCWGKVIFSIIFID